jgi:hypothetical protein
MILCPTCRTAVPDAEYHRHQQRPDHNPTRGTAALRLEEPSR